MDKDTQTNRQTVKQPDRHTHNQTDRQIDTHKQMDKHTQTNKQTDR